MRIGGRVGEWEPWTGMAFPGSGQHVVPGAAGVVAIDRERDVGASHDPDVWMVHPPGDR
jgi:hypothetical protein